VKGYRRESEGDLDLTFSKTIRDSGYRGAIVILSHTGIAPQSRLGSTGRATTGHGFTGCPICSYLDELPYACD
jgi:hypothetical protein